MTSSSSGSLSVPVPSMFGDASSSPPVRRPPLPAPRPIPVPPPLPGAAPHLNGGPRQPVLVAEVVPSFGPLLREVLRGREMRVTLFSCVIHMLLIIALAFMTIAAPVKKSIQLTASVERTVPPPQMTALSESLEPLVAAGPRVRSTATIIAPTPSNIAAGRTSPPANVLAGLNEMIFRDSASTAGAGGPDKVEFFGTVGFARKIVFVVDASGSMDGGKFERCKEELLTAISNLSANQRFYVFFFNDFAHPMFEPKTVGDALPLTTENWEKLTAWVGQQRPDLGTQAKAAMRRAFALKPDAIFLLTDGFFSDDTYQFLMRYPTTSVRVHTIGFQLEKEGDEILQAIAKRFRGEFTKVD